MSHFSHGPHNARKPRFRPQKHDSSRPQTEGNRRRFRHDCYSGAEDGPARRPARPSAGAAENDAEIRHLPSKSCRPGCRPPCRGCRRRRNRERPGRTEFRQTVSPAASTPLLSWMRRFGGWLIEQEAKPQVADPPWWAGVRPRRAACPTIFCGRARRSTDHGPRTTNYFP